MKSYLIMLAVFTFAIMSCQKEEQATITKEKNEFDYEILRVEKGKESLIRTKEELNLAVEAYLADNTDIYFAELRTATDSKGEFVYIYSKGVQGELYRTIGIPLSQKDDGWSFLIDSGRCDHECNANTINPCTTCDLTIHERCERQSCTCKTGDGACSGKITLYSED